MFAVAFFMPISQPDSGTITIVLEFAMATATHLDQAKRGRGRPPKVHTEAAHDRIKPAIPHELEHFDSLPDSAHVRLPIVRALYGASASTIWRNAKAGAIPEPRKLTPAISAWNVGELRAALNNRGAA